jgi:hypothetical protein
MIGMMIFILYRFFEVYNLFERHLPGTAMDASAVWIASRLIGFVMVFAMLLISVNLSKFKYERAAVALGCIITLFINWFFWEAWVGTWEELIFKNTVAVFTALFDVAFGYLFVEKWGERKHAHDTQHTISELEQRVSELRAKESKIKGELSETSAKVEQRMRALKETTCPGCGREFASKNAVNAHVHRCERNP